LNIKVSPNPINAKEQKLTLFLSGMEFAHIQLFDLLGKEIFNSSLSSGTHQLQLPEDAGGIYLLKIIDNKGNHESKKIIIN
jgi:hypothetical protein